MALKLANIQCELREVRLSNKPEHMLKVSPKGTVPILILEDEVIDESIDIINWVLDNSNIFKDNINLKQIELTENIITTFEGKENTDINIQKNNTNVIKIDHNISAEKRKKIIIDLRKEMVKAAKELDFIEAGRLRDLISSYKKSG